MALIPHPMLGPHIPQKVATTQSLICWFGTDASLLQDPSQHGRLGMWDVAVVVEARVAAELSPWQHLDSTSA
jgi:hypothetical protein